MKEYKNERYIQEEGFLTLNMIDAESYVKPMPDNTKVDLYEVFALIGKPLKKEIIKLSGNKNINETDINKIYEHIDFMYKTTDNHNKKNDIDDIDTELPSNI